MSAKQQRHYNAAQHFQKLLDESHNKTIINFLMKVINKHHILSGV